MQSEPQSTHSPNTVELIQWSDLGAHQREQWAEIRSGSPDYRTPFFSVAFSDAVDKARGDVVVAVLRSSGECVGFLPYHQSGKVAFPAGRFFNDAQNVVLRSGMKLDWMWLLEEMGVTSYDFHSLCGPLPSQRGIFAHGITESFSADLGDDSEAYLARLEKDHKTIRRQEQKTRKMAREVGDVTLEMDCRDPALLRQTIAWKRQQYNRTNILDLFSPDWTRRLVEHLFENETDEARGILSVLRAGDEVVAAHFGMIEGDLLHYWFPAYNHEYSRYSPGTALFKAVIRDASSHGISCVDMGYGEQPYKRKQTDTITTVTHGCFSRSKLHHHRVRTSKAAREAMKNLPMKSQLKAILRQFVPDAGISKLR